MRQNYCLKLIISFLCFSLCSGISLRAQFIQTISHLDKFNTIQVNEQIYLHTDCEVYAPGDTIWFKAYIRSKANLEKSYLSNVMYLFLFSDKGQIVGKEKLVISDAQSAGHLVIDDSQEEGSYMLVCYSSWMKNFGPAGVYRKKIQIISDSKEGYRFVPHFNRASYLPGDTVEVLVKCYDNFDNQIENSRFRYNFLVDNKVVQRGVGHSAESGPSPLSYIIPDTLEMIPELHVWDGMEDLRCKVPLNAEIDVEFFPEGGNYLINRYGNVAFKAMYTSGIPAAIEGEIIDEQGELLSLVKSEHDGMGRFVFAPETGRNCFLKITKPVGYEGLFALPDGKVDGWALEARNGGKKILVNVSNNAEKFETCLVLLSIRGYSYYYKLISSKAQAAFSIPTTDLPAGIGVLTLLDSENRPQAERLVFVNQDRFVNSDVGSDRKVYLPRDSVTLQIDMNSEQFAFEKGQYSLSVSDKMFGSSELIDEPSIIASNYLSPEIRGVIHNPNYYFKSHDNETAYHLDLLLMTQGWRNYKYLDSFAEIDSLKQPQIQDFIKGNISQFVFFKEPRPVKGHVLVYFAGNSQKFPTDEQGNFLFLPEFTDKYRGDILISGYGEKSGSEKIILNLKEDEFQNELEAHLVESFDSVESNFQQPTFLNEEVQRKMEVSSSTSIWLEEVEVKGDLKVDFEDPYIEMIQSVGTVRTASSEVLMTAVEIEEIVFGLGYYVYRENEFLMINYRGSMANPTGGPIPIKFVVDGVDYGFDYSFINTFYKPWVLKNLFVMTGIEAKMLYNNEVVIYIQPDEELYKKQQVDDDTYSGNRTVRGVQAFKVFYNPKYSTEEERNFPIPDLRKTIHWEPDIKIDETGKAHVTFFNADRYSRIRCVLEGMTDSGVPVYGETYYDVSIYRE